jgi:hypothetical protein
VREGAAIALAADTASITVMETVDNAIVLVVPGAMDAGLGDALFWGSLAPRSACQAAWSTFGRALTPSSGLAYRPRAWWE